MEMVSRYFGNGNGLIKMNAHVIKGLKFSPLIVALAMGLSSCGGGDASNPSIGRGSATTSSNFSNTGFTLDITDAAIDSAQEVWIQFTGVSIQPTDGDRLEFIFDSPQNINLLALQGTNSAHLLDNVTLPTCTYDWIRLNVVAENDGILDSYIKLDDGSEHELSIPSGSQTGLKINTSFEMVANQQLSFTVDFDLRQSVVLHAGEYSLGPVLRLVDTSEVGSITGTIDPSYLTGVNCSDADPDTGNAVYVFEGAGTTPDDMDNQSADLITSARVELNTTTGDYEYVVGFIPGGDYTVAFTCAADQDDPKSNDNIVFVYTENTTVTVSTSGDDIIGDIPDDMPR